MCLREHPGLVEMLGYTVPSAETARKSLSLFHDESKIEEARRALGAGGLSYSPDESAPLQGLAAVNREVVQELGSTPSEAEDRHPRSGRHHHRELEAAGQAHLRGLPRISNHLGAVGGDERGGGRRAPRRQRAGASDARHHRLPLEFWPPRLLPCSFGRIHVPTDGLRAGRIGMTNSPE